MRDMRLAVAADKDILDDVNQLKANVSFTKEKVHFSLIR